MAVCDSCSRVVIWVTTKSGKRMPLDPNPIAKNAVTFESQQGLFTENLATVHKEVYRSHFETCPDADKHRKR